MCGGGEGVCRGGEGVCRGVELKEFDLAVKQVKLKQVECMETHALKVNSENEL